MATNSFFVRLNVWYGLNGSIGAIIGPFFNQKQAENWLGAVRKVCESRAIQLTNAEVLMPRCQIPFFYSVKKASKLIEQLIRDYTRQRLFAPREDEDSEI